VPKLLEDAMGLRDLLVYVDQTASSFVRLSLAVDLAARHSSRLTAIFVREWNLAQLAERSTAELGLVSGEEFGHLHERVEASIDGAAEQLRSALDGLAGEHGLAAKWLSVDGPASVVAQHARYADLCILGRDAPPNSSSGGYSFSEQMLFVTGRPVLFVPSVGSFEMLGRHIAAAWNSSRAAARAVNDALPLIERSEHTTVLTVNFGDFMEQNGALPADQMVEHLRRHGALTDLVRLENVPVKSVGDVLQAKAQELGADLIVAGAFGHPRLWEKLLGGVTRDLLDRMRLPIFMSH
jgi:nucleotide-binding universal stress UspA family protein